MYYHKCNACGAKVEYDGFSAGVANFTNQTLMCEEVLRHYWDNFFRNRNETFHAYWDRINTNYKHSGYKWMCKTTFT